MFLTTYPIAPMIIALFIPLIYSIKNQNKHLKQIILLLITTISITILYPLTTFLQNNINPELGYFIGKLIIFTIFPFILVLYLDKQNVKKTLTQLGITKQNLHKSIFFGLLSLIITLTIIALFLLNNIATTTTLWNCVMFLDAFNEEFFFRSLLFLYLWKITNAHVAATTSILAFILAHPQYYYPHIQVGGFLQTSLQGILLTFVTYKTKNVVGPWISHGLNRVIPQLLRIFII